MRPGKKIYFASLHFASVNKSQVITILLHQSSLGLDFLFGKKGWEQLPSDL